jgi:ATP-dependent exoDNAse (exonuclease V) alpha subunit
MAIYHYHREIGKRGEGKNAVFGAAYIRGEKKTCERTGETKDFSNKPDVIYKNTFIPEDSPLWAKNLRNSSVVDSEGKKHTDINGELFSTYAWNQIEFSEKRVDSQVYFHDDFALPNSLNKEQAIELVNEFVKNTLALDGLFCDVAIHWDDNNHHFHVLLPMRTLTEEGFSKKIRRSKSELAKEVLRIREQWSIAANHKLQSLGINERIDHRSYKDRGIDLLPTVKVGKFSHFPDQSISMRKVQENELIRIANSDAIQQNPDILAEKILQERTFFDSNIVADEINRHVLLEQLNSLDASVTEIADPIFERLLQSIQDKEGIFNERTLKRNVLELVDTEAEFQRIYTKIISHEHVFSLGLGEDGRQHFVGRHAFDLENQLLKTTHYLATQNTFKVSKRLVRQVGNKFGLNKAQQRALLHLTRSGNVALVCGYAGTGKTYMLKAAKEVWEQSGYNLIGLATAGKAASGLEMETGIASKTIHSFLSAVRNNKITVDNKTILVMDEMGMTTLDDMSAVMEITRMNQAKLAGVGDIEQTQPVGRGAPQRAMVDAVGAVYLDTIIRQKTDWQREATMLFETNQTAAGFDLYAEHGLVHLHETHAIAAQETVNRWYANYSNQHDAALKEFIMAAFKNETVNALNLMAREKLVAQGVIAEGSPIVSESGAINVAVGERLLFTRNDSRVGVRNGDFATVLSLSEDTKTLHVQLDGGSAIAVNLAQYQHFVYGYAATVHKLQGHTTKDCNVLVDGDGWDRHKFLVAATRHKESLNIHAAQENFVDLAHLKASVSRHGLNDILTDFPVAFAERRGFNLNTSATMAAQMIQKGKAKLFDAVGYLFNYQAAVEQGNSAYDLSIHEIEARRKDAVIVAEFCDNRVELATLLNQMNEAGKEHLQQSTYALQLRNGEIASMIKANPQNYAIALERNRVSDSKIEAAFAFYERHHFVDSLVRAHGLSETILPEVAFDLVSHIKAYYSSICHQLPDKEGRNAFLRDMEIRADIHRRDSALDVFGIENRALVNMVSRYKALDYEVGVSLKGLESATDSDKKELYLAGINRDKLAAELISSPHYEALSLHFALNPERVLRHAEKYNDRMVVKAFAEQATSTHILGNLAKQATAHRIKSEPKRYGIYVDEYLKEGWKSINLEKWFYERRKTIAFASPELKRSINQVRRYKVAASSAYLQWQKAIERSKKESPHKNKGFKQAQGLSWKRSLLAHELMGNLHQHVAALSLEKVDTIKLYQQALQVDYLNRYRTETRETLKLRMARHINENLKDFQAGLAVYGLYQDVKERATHFTYLQRIKNAPEPEMKTLIRLALDYKDKKVEAGIAWGQIKALKQLNIDTRGLLLQAKHLMVQRNESAHNLLQACSQRAWLTKEITGTKLDLNVLERESNQYLANKDVMRYLSLPKEQRGELAQTLLANKAGYHLLFDNNISFDVLNKEARQYERLTHLASAAKVTKDKEERKPQKTLWDIERITQALMNNPIDTYTAILGEPKERATNHLRYSGGLIVSTKGSDAGKWYSFTEEVGGTPLSALQKYLNLSFPEALAHGASLAGLSDFEAKVSATPKIVARPEPQPIDNQSEQKIKNGKVSAQSIWNSTVEAKGTLAERYFMEHRKVDSIEGMAIRYWPKGAVWIDFDADGNRIEKPNKIPAAVIAARNVQGDVVSVQRVYLDEKTAGKNTFLKDAKLTKGSNKGAPGVIQESTKGGVLFIAEGPETGASIASLDKEATVLVSFSVSNISNMAEVIKQYAPKQVFIAADNDGELSASYETTEKACQFLRSQGIDARIVSPELLPNQTKTDWNDILVTQGKEALWTMFQAKMAQTQFLYEQGRPIAGTVAENYFKNEHNSIDLKDVRFIESIAFKGQSVPAMMVPRTNEQGLLCGETVFALSAEGKAILSEGNKRGTQEGFYVAQLGHGETLIIADTLRHAKVAAQTNPEATVILSKVEDHEKLHLYLSEQKIHPVKVVVLRETHDRDQQILISHSCNRFHAEGAELYLMNSKEDLMTKLNPVALEKSRLKMSFEKLISIKPAAVEENKTQVPQERFNELKKEYPILKQYEHHSKERRKVSGFAREQIDKQLLSLAKEMATNKQLIATLQQELPQLALDIKQRIQHAQNHNRSIN